MDWVQGKLKHGRRLGIPYRLWKRTADNRIKILRRLCNPFKNSMPIFLIGCGRSGTNMLTRSLDKSFQVDLFNEDHPAAFENWRIKDFTIIEQLVNSGYTWIKLIKPILDTHMACEFLSYFPRSKIVFVFRHYNDVINSSNRLFGPNNWQNRVRCWVENDFAEFDSAPPPDKTKKNIISRWNNGLSAHDSIALYWLFYNRLYFDLELNRSDRVILVNYENVVLQPSSEFRILCGFLNMKYSSSMVKEIFSTSIKRDRPPQIEASIQEDCNHLWDKLCSSVRNPLTS